MTRIPGNAPIQVRPQNDMLTAMLAAACVAVLIALIVLVVRSYSVFEGGLFGQLGS